MSVLTTIITDAISPMKFDTMHAYPYCLVIFFITLTLVISAGCAKTSSVVIEEEIATGLKPMTAYTALQVRDFELKKELYINEDDSTDDLERRYADVVERLSRQIVDDSRLRRTFQNVSRDTAISPGALVLKGRFVRTGRFRISVEAMLSDSETHREVAYFRQTLWDVKNAADGIDSLAREIVNSINRIQRK